MKTSFFFLILFLVASTGCDSAVEQASPQLADKGSSFSFSEHEFDVDGNPTGESSTVFTIDSTNIALESRTDVMRMSSATDTLHFIRDANRSLLIYRPEVEIFDGIALPKRWQPILKEYNTDTIAIGTYTGQTQVNGLNADVTVSDYEQYIGTSTVTVNGKTFETIVKSFSVKVEVYISQFDVKVTTIVTDIYGFAPELGFLVSMKQIRSADSEFSPIIPGRTELMLSSYTM